MRRASATVVFFALIVSTSPGAEGSGDVTFQRHAINAESTYSACAVFDVNADGRIDIFCGGWWYEAPEWKKHFVREVQEIRGRFDGYSHLPHDVNGDGWLDVINVNYRSQSIFWIEHPGADRLDQPWKKHTLALPGAMESGRLHDDDGDGRLDLLPNGVKFAAWWELVDPAIVKRDGGPIAIRHNLPDDVASHGVGFGDLNGDGRGDVVGVRGWLEAPEDARAGEWRWRPEFELDRDASVPILVVDVDRDGDNDLIWGRGHDFGVQWLEHRSDGDWAQHEIDTTWSQAHAMLWVDVDGDGHKDLVTGKRYMAHDGKDPGARDPLVVYWYSFDPAAGAWTRHVVSRGERVGFGLDPKAIDLDDDGDLDLVVSGRSGLYWMENRRKGETDS